MRCRKAQIVHAWRRIAGKVHKGLESAWMERDSKSQRVHAWSEVEGKDQKGSESAAWRDWGGKDQQVSESACLEEGRRERPERLIESLLGEM